MKASLIRHAEKENGGHYNPRLRHQDEPLTARGQEQARRLPGYFAGRTIAAVYVSGYRRTAQTAAPLAQRLRLEPVVDERLNEIDNGLLEGLSDAEIEQRYPDFWRAFIERTADIRFPEGETGEEVRHRVDSFLADTRRRHPGEEIIIAHDGLIRLTMCHILGLPVYDRWKFRIDFCGICEMVYQEDAGWRMLRFNQSAS